MRAVVFISVLLISVLLVSAPAFAQQCRCREVLEHPGKDNRPKYMAAACPNVDADPGYKGEGMRLKFKQVGVEEFYGLLADFSGARVCLGDGVGGNLAVDVAISTPWNVVAQEVAKSKGYRAQVSRRVIYIYASLP